MIEYYLPSVLNPDCALSINTDIEYDFLAEVCLEYHMTQSLQSRLNDSIINEHMYSSSKSFVNSAAYSC